MSVFGRFPVDMPPGWISQKFGNLNTWEAQPHSGLDIAADAGTPIYAPCDAFVVWASFDPFPPGNTWEQLAGSRASGGCTILQPTGPHTSLQTSISHQMELMVQPGEFVREDQLIGRVGSTGNSSGPHVHWEAFIDYAEGLYPAGTFYGRVNPLDYFKTANVVPVANTGGKGSTTLKQEGFLMALTDEQQQNLYNRIMGGIPAGPARTPEQIGGANPPRLADSGDIWDLKQLLKKTLNTDGGNVLLAAIAEASGKTVSEVAKHAQAIADVDRQYIPDRLKDVVEEAK